MRWITNGCVSCLALGLIAGCGQSAAPPPAASAAEASTGQERAQSGAKQSESEQAPAATTEPQGPARLTVEAKVHGKPVAATVHLITAAGNDAESGESGQTINTQSGEYELRVEIKDAAAMLDKPTQSSNLTLHAGDDLHQSVEFPWAMIQLNVMVNGNLEHNATVQLSRQGSVVGSIKSGAAPVAISPGRYEAEVKARGATIAVKGLMFPEGATQTVPVNVQM